MAGSRYPSSVDSGPHPWVRRRILIWGKTRPELSKRYKEIVCTGGVGEDGRLVRLYPIPLRFMDDTGLLKSYRWIRATVKKAAQDSRPESYQVRFDDVEGLEQLGTNRGTWADRAEWILRKHNLADSVEHLQVLQAEDGTSLRLVAPREVLDVTWTPVKPAEQVEFYEKLQEVKAQHDLPDDNLKAVRPLPAPDFKFYVHFRCDDSRCPGTHRFRVLDWGVDALYFRSKKREGESTARVKTVEKLWDACGPKKDTRFFLGNLNHRRETFTIVGLWYPKKLSQPRLF